MKRTYRDLSPDEVSAVVTLNPETGEFYRRVAAGRGKPAGSVATRKAAKGYRGLTIGGVPVLAHRLVWFLMHGEWPAHDLDHINGDRSDNRPANLREVTRALNMQNLRRAHADTRSQLLGAYFDPRRGRWYSSICTGGIQKFLGYFDTAEQAHLAYIAAKRRVHEACTL